MTSTECLLNHAEPWDTQVIGCTSPATHLWLRPGRSPLPICARGIKPGREIVPVTPDLAEITVEIAQTRRGLAEIRQRPFAYDPGAGDMLDMRLAMLEADLTELTGR